MHGILDNLVVIESLIAPYTNAKSESSIDIQQFKDIQYDALANHLRQHCDIEFIYSLLKQ